MNTEAALKETLTSLLRDRNTIQMRQVLYWDLGLHPGDPLSTKTVANVATILDEIGFESPLFTPLDLDRFWSRRPPGYPGNNKNKKAWGQHLIAKQALRVAINHVKDQGFPLYDQGTLPR